MNIITDRSKTVREGSMGIALENQEMMQEIDNLKDISRQSSKQAEELDGLLRQDE